ncbi:MAG: NAD(P)-dependent oxidoreductase [Candidatus Thermoplasmatota archaeon]|jgi:3-hydroxyisobutyrate dehydrogenase-like beta-hydroxyacid dehydrogenase|nr:NAD(P)-dependent oxidoreductase [Candidatus Thermoplasmatota archaeon]
MENVGFIGLGKMGVPMAKRIKNAGYDLMVYNRTKAKSESLKSLGFKVARTPKEVVEFSKYTITMLTDSEAVEQTFYGSDGIMHALGPGKTYIDMSTISPSVSMELAKISGSKGGEMLDAPVTGSIPSAENGELTIMVGGKKETFEKAKELLSTMGKNVVYIGENGSGLKMKLINNIILGGNMAILAEALLLGQANGLDPELQFRIISTGTAHSRVMDMKRENIINNSFPSMFNLEHEVKDLNYAMEMARGLLHPMVIASEVTQLYEMAFKKGFAKKDFSSIYGAIKLMNEG